MHKADGYLLKAFYEYWTGSFHKVQEDAVKARELSEDIQNLIAPYWSFLLEGFAHLAHNNFSLASESFIQGDDILVKVFPDDPSVHADREFFLGLTEIMEGKIQDARKRLAIITRILSESRDPDKK